MSHEKTLYTPQTILLLDDYYISGKKNVKRQFHYPQKCSDAPFFNSKQVPWDTSPVIFGTTVYDPLINRYRMWYHSSLLVPKNKNPHSRMTLAVAQSRDAINWKRGKLDIVKYSGKPTNIVFQSSPNELFIEVCSVLIDPHAPENRRYMMSYCAIENTKPLTVKGRFYRLAWSSDGIHWNRGHKIPVTHPGAVDRHAIIKNPYTGEYLFYHRGDQPFRKKFPTEDRAERTVMLMTSPDLKNWESKGTVLAPDETYPQYTNIYSLNPFFRGNTIVGIYQIHDQHCENEIVTTHLCWSHDRVNFNRRKEQFIPLGNPGSWDRFNQATSSQPIVVGDKMYFYYSGRCRRHSGYQNPTNDCGPIFSGIAMAEMKLDRFASLSSSFDSGCFSTKTLQIDPGKKLFINAEARWGKITIECCHEKQSICSNTVEGKEGVEIPVKIPRRYLMKPITLKFKLCNAQIFALYWK
jgi:hypothetical protein